MRLTTWNPMREMDALLGRGFRSPGEDVWMPAVDIRENEQAFVISAEVPGVDKKDIEVTVDNGVLTLSGERSEESEEKDARHHRRERYYGSFSRSFSLPDDVDADRIDAKSRDGVIEITIPKPERPAERKAKIDVK